MHRGRYAPSPTGYLHFGNVRTALLAWLQTRSQKGAFILRIEDIDRSRSHSHYAEAIMADLKWLGLDWDEGPDCGGKYAPYNQSQRESLYEQAFQRLVQQGRVYPCYCSRADLRGMAYAPHGIAGEGPIYDGRCLRLSEEEIKQKRKSKQPSYRFRIPRHHPISYVDGFAGHTNFPAGFGGDFIVKRADGIYSYQLSVVIDDASMHITDVVRGYDLLDSTPRQLWLYEALGLQPPTFFHVPLVLGHDGARLSKRHGDITIRACREAGLKPETVIGQLAYMSGIIDQPEDVRASDLINHFHMDQVKPKSITVTEQTFHDWLHQS